LVPAYGESSIHHPMSWACHHLVVKVASKESLMLMAKGCSGLM